VRGHTSSRAKSDTVDARFFGLLANGNRRRRLARLDLRRNSIRPEDVAALPFVRAGAR
jgi:hypothetical protein